MTKTYVLIRISFCRSVTSHSLLCLPLFTCHSLRGCPLSAPPAGGPQTSSDRRSQPRSHSGLLPPSATCLYEHELCCLLPQVSAAQLQQTANQTTLHAFLKPLTSVLLLFFNSFTLQFALQPPSFSLHSWLLRSPTRSNGSCSRGSVPPRRSCRLLSAASAGRPGQDAGSALQHWG